MRESTSHLEQTGGAAGQSCEKRVPSMLCALEIAQTGRAAEIADTICSRWFGRRRGASIEECALRWLPYVFVMRVAGALMHVIGSNFSITDSGQVAPRTPGCGSPAWCPKLVC